MKYSIPFLTAVFILVFGGCNSSDCLQGSGKQVSSLRNIQQFAFIEAEGNIKLILKQSPALQIRIVADDNIQEHISVKVKNRRLVVGMKRDLCNQTPITVYASSPQMEGVDVSGAVEVESDGPISSQSFELGMSGASKAAMTIRCGDLHTDTSGASKLMLTGQAGTHDLKMSGASELNALDFVVGVYNINTSGASNLNINVLNELNVESSGSSEIKYRGNPQHIRNDKSGASSIIKVN